MNNRDYEPELGAPYNHRHDKSDFEVVRDYHRFTEKWDLDNCTGPISMRIGVQPANAQERFRSTRKANVIKNRLMQRHDVQPSEWGAAMRAYTGSYLFTEDLQRVITEFLAVHPEFRPRVTP